MNNQTFKNVLMTKFSKSLDVENSQPKINLNDKPRNSKITWFLCFPNSVLPSVAENVVRQWSKQIAYNLEEKPLFFCQLGIMTYVGFEINDEGMRTVATYIFRFFQFTICKKFL